MLRIATSDDIPTLVDLINRAYRVEDFFIHGNRTYAEQVKIYQQEGEFLMLYEHEKLLGCVHVSVQNDRGFFAMLAVEPTLQKSGIGKKLIAACEAYCLDRGCLFLDLAVVNCRKELPAFYGRFGFTPYKIGIFPEPYKLKRPAHLVYLTKPLTTLFS